MRDKLFAIVTVAVPAMVAIPLLLALGLDSANEVAGVAGLFTGFASLAIAWRTYQMTVRPPEIRPAPKRPDPESDEHPPARTGQRGCLIQVTLVLLLVIGSTSAILGGYALSQSPLSQSPLSRPYPNLDAPAGAPPTGTPVPAPPAFPVPYSPPPHGDSLPGGSPHVSSAPKPFPAPRTPPAFVETVSDPQGAPVFGDTQGGPAPAGTPGRIPSGARVLVLCKVPNTSPVTSVRSWYRIGTTPWRNTYAPSDSFAGPAVPDCR